MIDETIRTQKGKRRKRETKTAIDEDKERCRWLARWKLGAEDQLQLLSPSPPSSDYLPFSSSVPSSSSPASSAPLSSLRSFFLFFFRSRAFWFFFLVFVWFARFTITSVVVVYNLVMYNRMCRTVGRLGFSNRSAMMWSSSGLYPRESPESLLLPESPFRWLNSLCTPLSDFNKIFSFYPKKKEAVNLFQFLLKCFIAQIGNLGIIAMII